MREVVPAILDQVVVIGGGRWARILAESLCGLLPASTEILIVSPRGRAELERWSAGRDARIRIAEDGIDATATRPGAAVIVANAAGDHVAAARWALSRKMPTLVEKPFALDAAEARAVAREASDGGVMLAAANVFRFPRYLEAFAARLSGKRDLRSIRIEWADPRSESRYGEAKGYDAAVPVFADCVPHVVSLLLAVFGDLAALAGPPRVARGGMRVDLQLRVGGLPCSVRLERNATARERRIMVETAQGVVELDFSVEPGVIRDGDAKFGADDAWDRAPRPLALLLSRFLAAAAGSPLDSRLEVGPALHACELTDAIRPPYREALHVWLASALADGVSLDDELRYALSEILHRGERIGEDELVEQHERLRLEFAAAVTLDIDQLLSRVRPTMHKEADSGPLPYAESPACSDVERTGKSNE